MNAQLDTQMICIRVFDSWMHYLSLGEIIIRSHVSGTNRGGWEMGGTEDVDICTLILVNVCGLC